MSVTIRLARGGRKGVPFYKIVVTDSKNARDGRFNKIIGSYDAIKKDLKMDKEAINEWVKKGAQMSDKVKQLFKNSDHEGNLKIKSKPKKKKKVAKTEEAAA